MGVSGKRNLINPQIFFKLYYYYITNKKSILLFLFVGTISAAVNIGSFAILWKFFRINYQFAVSVSYVLSVILHFLVNRKLTFEGDHTHFLMQMPRYLTMIIVNYLITLGVTRMVVELLHLTPYLGIIFSISVTINVSYLMMRYWVFPRTT
jgi:putative flippase GtrA